MRQYLYNNKGVIMWTTIFTTVGVFTQLYLGINTEFTIKIAGVGKYHYHFPPLVPFQIIISLLHGYNTFFQSNGIKEKIFDNDDILDS